jgi:hypothetical protein
MSQILFALLCSLAFFANVGYGFRTYGRTTRRYSSNFNMMATSTSPSNPMEEMMKSFQNMMAPKAKSVKAQKIVKVDTTQYDAEIADTKAFLVNAAITKKEDGDKVVDALLSLEQLMRAKNKLDEGNRKLLHSQNLNCIEPPLASSLSLSLVLITAVRSLSI